MDFLPDNHASFVAGYPLVPNAQYKSRVYSSSLTSISVFFHWRAGMWRLNMMSISRYDRPFISGRQKYAVTKQMKPVAPQT